MQEKLLDKQMKPTKPFPFSWFPSLPWTLLLMKILNTILSIHWKLSDSITNSIPLW